MSKSREGVCVCDGVYGGKGGVGGGGLCMWGFRATKLRQFWLRAKVANAIVAFSVIG